jgi:hypothetical protein
VSVFDPKQDAAALNAVVDHFTTDAQGQLIPALGQEIANTVVPAIEAAAERLLAKFSTMLDEKIDRLERLTLTNVTNISEKGKP